MSGMPRRPRRPDHWSSPHERARSRAAERLDTALDPDESMWLDRHLLECADCRSAAAAYEADRTALRSLRDVQIDPPRDLWARTAAGIEREAARRGRGPRRAPATGGSRFPLGAVSGVMVVVIVVGAAAVSGGWLDQPAVAPAGTPAIADASLALGTASLVPPATPMSVAAGSVTWIHSLSDGDYAFNVSNVDHVCPVEDQPGCAALDEGPPERIALDSTPRTIIGSPTDDRAVVVGPDGSGSDKVFVMSLPESTKHTSTPSETPVAPTDTASPGTGTGTASPSAATPTPNASSEASASPPSSAGTASETPATSPVAPTETPETTPVATPEATPTESAPVKIPSPSPTISASPQATASAIAIASGVTVVGQSAAFSSDGRWFAFTARPADGSAGPDIYVWHIGDAKARQLTTGGGSVFASWADDQVVGSRLEVDDVQAADAVPGPVSFIADPKTGKEIGDPVALWRPVVDPTGRFAVAWDGRVSTNDAGTILAPGNGQLVVTSWHPDGSEVATRSQVPGGDAPMADFDIRWDPSGDWVAIWTADATDPSIGRLSLYRLHDDSGTLTRPKGAPRNVPAVPGFSIGDGRLAWVTPHGQDAEGSKVQVVAWSGDGVGAVESVPADDVVVVR